MTLLLWSLFALVCIVEEVLCAYDDLVITQECWRASEWNDILQNDRLNKSHIIHNAVSIEFVDYIMNETMKYVAENGWRTDRHNKYTATTDIDTILVDGLNTSIIQMTEGFYPMFSEYYDIPTELLRIFETFVVKYEFKEGVQNTLEPHQDGCEYSFVLALNDPNEYEGGGTRFDYNNKVVKLNKGDLVIFPGKLMHEGVAVTKGTRLILAGFLRVIQMSNGEGCVETMEKFKIVITNHLDVWVELFWYEESIGYIERGDWIEIGSYSKTRFTCNDNLCDFFVELGKRYYDIWPR